MCKKKFVALMLLVAVVLVGCSSANTSAVNGITSQSIEIIDDSGETITLDKPATRIISLYSAHTENLFALGLEQEIIGVSTKESYPAQAKEKPKFDYRGDPEKVLAQQPDLVIIRPFIEKSAPDFVQALKNAGVTVVSLYPDTFASFDDYIKKLALLTGREAQGEKKLREFHQKLDEIQSLTNSIEPKRKVFFESTGHEYRTITPDSMPAELIKIAGGVNIAQQAKAVRPGSSIASYNVEKLLTQGPEIDVYIAQRGAMNQSTPEEIKKRAGFDRIKAVQQGRVYNIDEKLVSSPTFRMAEGAAALAKIIYPDVIEE